MFVEPGVFDRQDGVRHDFRYLLDGREVTALFAKLADQNTLGGKDAQRQFGAVIGQVGNVGQIRECHCQRNSNQYQKGQTGS